MASACKSVADCIDAHEPVRATYVNLYRWPESDAEFVRSLAMKNKCTSYRAGAYRQCNIDYAGDEKRKEGQRQSPSVVDSYSCRQIYLRSYTFSKKESVPEKTVKCLGIVRDKMASFPFLHRSDHDEDFDRRSNVTIDSEKEKNKKKQKKKRKRKKKDQSTVPTAKKLREVSCNVVWMIFHRLLACAASVDVVDR